MNGKSDPVFEKYCWNKSSASCSGGKAYMLTDFDACDALPLLPAVPGREGIDGEGGLETLIRPPSRAPPSCVPGVDDG